MNAKKKVVVGLSGGVDSSVCALLLKEQGFDVYGVTLRLVSAAEEYEMERPKLCCGEAAVRDAGLVAAKLGVPHLLVNREEIFSERIIDRFAREYAAGRTPNPCVLCNPMIKWHFMCEKAKELGADYVATGHYARVRKLSNGRLTVSRAEDKEKDQTYMLYGLSQEQLKKTILPLGDYRKEEIRRIAEEAGFAVSKKPDSQEICFVPDKDYASFLETSYKELFSGEGNFVTKDGKILGPHKGIHHYTIGQRKHLGLSAGHPLFVSEIRPDTKEVVVGEEAEVFTDTVYAKELRFMGAKTVNRGIYHVKVRYAHAGQEALVERVGEDLLKCRFNEPVRAATPGQAVVFYSDDWVAAGGTITMVKEVG